MKKEIIKKINKIKKYDFCFISILKAKINCSYSFTLYFKETEENEIFIRNGN